MIYKIRGWYEGEVGASIYRGRVTALTQNLADVPALVNVYRRSLDEFIVNEASVDANPDTFSRQDFAEDDETVPEEQRGYTWLEMTS